jgi:hypothetical protein
LNKIADCGLRIEEEQRLVLPVGNPKSEIRIPQLKILLGKLSDLEQNVSRVCEFIREPALAVRRRIRAVIIFNPCAFFSV